MHRSRSHRRFGVVAALGLVLLLAGVRTAVPSAAQQGTPAATTPAASPGASPVGSPEAFVDGTFRIAVVAARRADAMPEVKLTAKSGKDWLVVVADATNWGNQQATLTIRDFGIRLTGGAAARGFAARTTGNVAALLALEPKNVNAGVNLGRDKTARITLVFQIDHEGVDPALVHDGQALPLATSLAAAANLLALPPAVAPPALAVAKVKDVPDGATLDLAAGGGTVKLAALDPPRPAECFGGKATSRLKKLAGDEVLLEDAGDGTSYVWAEQQDGVRRLLNYDLLAEGYAALGSNPAGAFAAWLSDGATTAQTKLAGLWGACTGPHGVARTVGPERGVLAVRSGDTNRDYEIWGVQAWAPVLVTTPDGGAWAFFSAQVADGPDKDKIRLYASRYDPSTGSWMPATPMKGGDVEFGPAAVVDARGLVHLVYSDRAKDQEGVYSTLMYSHEDGFGGWTDPIPVAPDPNAGHQVAPSLAMDAGGTLYALWQDQRSFSPEALASAINADVYASDLPPNGAWSAPVRVNPHLPTAAGGRPKVVVDGDRLVAVWSVYTSASGPAQAARIDWATRPLDQPNKWSDAKPLVVGRGERFGGQGVDLAADPNGGVVLAYTRQVNDTFLFVRRLKPGTTEWGGDVLITFGDRGTYPSLTINAQGVVYITYNAGIGSVVDVGAVAIPFRSIEPGPEFLLTQGDPYSQGLAVVTTDGTGSPWLIYYSETPGQVPNKVYVLRNAVIPTGQAATPTPAAGQ